VSRRPAARRRDADVFADVPLGVVRLDLWLIAARVYKTRTLAQDACVGGHVKLNERAAGPGHDVKLGDVVDAWAPAGRRVLRVKGLAARRGPSEAARTLYDDLTPRAPEVPPPPVSRDRGAGRPTKQEGRELRRLKGYAPDES